MAPYKHACPKRDSIHRGISDRFQLNVKRTLYLQATRLDKKVCYISKFIVNLKRTRPGDLWSWSQLYDGIACSLIFFIIQVCLNISQVGL